jgi:hypothetical protein
LGLVRKGSLATSRRGGLTRGQEPSRTRPASDPADRWVFRRKLTPVARHVLLRHADFRRLVLGTSISLLGSSVTSVALPLAAVVTLHASIVYMGLLGAATLLPHFLLGLPAGVGRPVALPALAGDGRPGAIHP